VPTQSVEDGRGELLCVSGSNGNEDGE